MGNSTCQLGFSNRNLFCKKRVVLLEKLFVFGGRFKSISATDYNRLWNVQIKNYDLQKHLQKETSH